MHSAIEKAFWLTRIGRDEFGPADAVQSIGVVSLGSGLRSAIHKTRAKGIDAVYRLAFARHRPRGGRIVVAVEIEGVAEPRPILQGVNELRSLIKKAK